MDEGDSGPADQLKWQYFLGGGWVRVNLGWGRDTKGQLVIFRPKYVCFFFKKRKFNYIKTSIKLINFFKKKNNNRDVYIVIPGGG